MKLLCIPSSCLRTRILPTLLRTTVGTFPIAFPPGKGNCYFGFHSHSFVIIISLSYFWIYTKFQNHVVKLWFWHSCSFTLHIDFWESIFIVNVIILRFIQVDVYYYNFCCCALFHCVYAIIYLFYCQWTFVFSTFL